MAQLPQPVSRARFEVGRSNARMFVSFTFISKLEKLMV
jgi:hypothetical protein